MNGTFSTLLGFFMLYGAAGSVDVAESAGDLAIIGAVSFVGVMLLASGVRKIKS